MTDLVSPDVSVRICEFITQNEGGCWHSYYKDKQNVVTIGVGLAIRNPSEAFEVGGTDSVAAWRTVTSKPPGMGPVWYAMQCPFRANQTDLDNVFNKRLNAFLIDLAHQLPYWSTIPDPGKVALADWAYQDGDALVWWPNFHDALGRRDWETCAKECVTNLSKGGVADRNAKRAQLFRDCLTWYK